MRVLPLLVAAAAVLGSAATAQAQLGIQNPEGPAPVTLYMHLLDIQDFPVNTQVPAGLADEGSRGLATHSLTCAPNPPASNVFQEHHTYRGYSSPSYVEYDFLQDGRPRTNAERGLGADVRLTPGAPLLLHWYLATSAGPAAGPLDALPQPLPGVVVQATLRASDAISVDDKAYDSGPVLAQGRSPPALLAAEATQGAEHSMAGGRHVYGITVPMAVQQATIPKATGYVLRIDVFLDNPACADPDQGNVMPASVQPYTDDGHLPRIEAAAASQLSIDRLEPRFAPNRTVAIDASVTAAWGAYDLDEGNVTLRVEGPGGPVEARLAELVQRTHEYHHVTEPVRATWVVDAEGLPAGLYRVTLEASNDQHTAAARAVAAFRLAPDAAYAVRAGEPVPVLADGTQAMPSGSPAAFAVLLALGASARRLFGNR